MDSRGSKPRRLLSKMVFLECEFVIENTSEDDSLNWVEQIARVVEGSCKRCRELNSSGSMHKRFFSCGK